MRNLLLRLGVEDFYIKIKLPPDFYDFRNLSDYHKNKFKEVPGLWFNELRDHVFLRKGVADSIKCYYEIFGLLPPTSAAEFTLRGVHPNNAEDDFHFYITNYDVDVHDLIITCFIEWD